MKEKENCGIKATHFAQACLSVNKSAALFQLLFDCAACCQEPSCFSLQKLCNSLAHLPNAPLLARITRNQLRSPRNSCLQNVNFLAHLLIFWPTCLHPPFVRKWLAGWMILLLVVRCLLVACCVFLVCLHPVSATNDRTSQHNSNGNNNDDDNNNIIINNDNNNKQSEGGSADCLCSGDCKSGGNARNLLFVSAVICCCDCCLLAVVVNSDSVCLLVMFIE